MENSNYSQKLLWGFIALFVALYALALFPFAYFRHDDWLNLGNAILRVPQNWWSLFSPSWIENGVEHVWFFRPFFKLSYYIGYQIFGFSYYGWLAATLVLMLFALFFGYKTVLKITGSTSAANFFAIFFCGNFHFHLGSLLWAGEGYMNVPSVFLLAFSMYCFTRYVADRAPLVWQILSIVLFVLALGFKEASFAHVVLLTGIYFSIKKKFEWLPKPLLPHALITAAYLVFRLYYLPINPHYLPKLGLGLEALVYFTVAFVAPFVWMLLFWGKQWTLLSKPKDLASAFFLLFLLSLLLPHQGHPFFSPGWLLSPGFFFCLILAVSIRDVQKFQLKPGPWLLLFLLSSGVVFGKLSSVQWWKWQQVQHEMEAILRSIPPKKGTVVRIRTCNTDPNLRLDRIIGYRGAISDWYESIHGRSLNFGFVPCSTPTHFDPLALWYDYRFPHITMSAD